jgi:hypothetical protein
MDATEIPALPFVDAHTTIVEADADAVWRELGTLMNGSRGFRVALSTPVRELAYVGHHPFSTYALIFHLDEADRGRTRLRAETRAHALVMRHVLRKVRRNAP